MFSSVDERVDRLESVFEQFMAQTSTAITHLDMTIARIDRSLDDFKNKARHRCRARNKMRSKIAASIISDGANWRTKWARSSKILSLPICGAWRKPN